MYLSELKLWNFRKYGNGESIYTAEKALRKPDLTVPFVKGINVLIGENDSGKTAIIDAIKLTLKTHSYESFSRPTHLLCFAIHKDRYDEVFKDIKPDEGENNLWQIEKDS